MIEYALLIMLGFCICGLIALLLAPTLWHRAVRLTTKRLEATMPMSLTEIEADKDLLRAFYAIKLRRLEAGLNKAREKSANQLVEISKHQMRISELNDDIARLNTELDERRNAANVFESTIRKRFPELETKVAVGQAALDERAMEITDLQLRLQRREEALEMAQRASISQQDEIRQLRDALERTGSDTTGRFKRRASQWGLEEYRSEYDRLNVEMSRMREQLSGVQQREAHQTSVLKTELQQLAERIMVSATATAQKQQVKDWREAEQARPVAQPAENERRPRAAARNSSSQQPTVSPRPWLNASEPKGKKDAGPEEKTLYRPEASPARKRSEKAKSKSAAASGVENGVVKVAASPKAEDREALQSLLGRAARISGQEQLEQKSATPASRAAASSDKAVSDKSAAAGLNGPAEAPVPSVSRAVAAKSSTDATTEVVVAVETAGQTAVIEAKDKASSEVASQEPATSDAKATKVEPKLDQVFREILEGGGASGKDREGASGATNSVAASSVKAEMNEDAVKKDSENSNTQTLLDRLRDMQENQSGKAVS